MSKYYVPLEIYTVYITCLTYNTFNNQRLYTFQVLSIFAVCYILDQVWYGIDWNGPLPPLPGDSVVVVNPPVIALEQSVYDELITRINPLEACRDFGIQLYVHFIQSRM